MKRRNFLTLIGAAATAPLIPALPAAAAPATALNFNQFTYGLAALHTRIEGGLPISEISRRFKLAPHQAEALAQKLVNDGFATRSGGIVTANRPFVNARGFGHTRTRARAERPDRRGTQTQPDTTSPTIPPLLAHLRQLSADYGMTLAPARLA
jgi:hypothetical protein